MSSRGMRRGNWSTHELERLRQLYPRGGEEHAAMVLRRSPSSVRRKATEIFEAGIRRGAWTKAEDAQLRESFGVLEMDALCLVLARARRDVEQRIAQLRRRRRRGAWTVEEEGQLRRLYGTRFDADLEVILSRSRTQIERTAKRLCLAKDKRFMARQGRGAVGRMPRWSAAEVARLRRLYPHHDNTAVARKLGRTVVSIANKASSLGLRKSAEELSRMGRRNIAGRDPATRG